jgi:hypothetical protein
MNFKYAVYRISHDDWIAYSSDTEIKENANVVKISNECFDYLQKNISFPCDAQGTVNLEEKILAKKYKDQEHENR